MGKLIRNGIEYGGGNGTDIFEVTQAEYDALVQAGTLVHNALYVITDAPNLNATAQDISYDGGATTVKNKIDVSDVSSAITLNANFSDTSKYLYKSANVCSLEIRGKLTATSATTIATFNNSAYYPKCSRVVTAYLDTDNPSATPNGAVWLYDNGNIVYFGNSVTSKNVIISVTYICKG